MRRINRGGNLSISIGFDISKRKSTVTIINVRGEILQTPFDMEHSQNGIQKLLHLIQNYPKDQVKFIMPQEFIT